MSPSGHDAAVPPVPARPPGPGRPPVPARPPGRFPHRAAYCVVLAVVLALSSLLTHSAAWASPDWAWPVSPRPAVSRHFEAPAQKWLPGHRGVDLHAPPGTPVRAPQDGVVSFVGVVVDREVLTVDHGDGHKSSFEPVSATVRVGDRVSRGQVIARVASRGHGPGGDAVHWGVREDGEYVNPLRFVADLRPSVLLPLPEHDGS